ncbi:MAG: hypothetical protein V3T17_03905 [Pseudomonadales bacterium]
MVSPIHIKIVGNVVYATPVESMNISKPEADALHDAVKNKISGKFGLIETRPSNTSIDPTVYRYAKKLMPQFIAFALVAESDLTFELFEIEEAFMKDIRFAIFRTLTEAEFWMQAILADEEKS